MCYATVVSRHSFSLLWSTPAAEEMTTEQFDADEHARLLARKQELEALLARVNRSLTQAGYKLDAPARAAGVKSGINIGGVLSFRGLEKAAELFDYLDEDRDGFLTFEDLRGKH